MPALRFGAFLAPHHPIGENPTLQLQSDLELVQLTGLPRIRRVLVRRAPLHRLGDDRLARGVSRGGCRAHSQDHAWHRRRLAAVSPPVHGRAATRAARSPVARPRDLRIRARCAAVRRPHTWHGPHGAARPAGRGDGGHPTPVRDRRPIQLRVRVVHTARRQTPAQASPGEEWSSPSPRYSPRRA